MLLGSLIFCGIGAGMIENPQEFLLISEVFTKLIGLLIFSFFAMCGLYATMKLFDKKPGLIFDEKGMTDNSSAVSAGFVAWEDIEDVVVSNVVGQKILTVLLKDPEVFLAKQTGIKHKIMTTNYKRYRSPVQLSANTLKCTSNDLQRMMHEYIAAHRK